MGVPLDTPEYVGMVLDAKASKCVSKIKTITRQLRGRCLHALWNTLYCCSTLLHYWLQLCLPDVMEGAAQVFDDALLSAAQIADPSLDGHAHGLVLRRLWQPARFFGCGLRSCVDLRNSAFIGAVEVVVPRLSDYSLMCTPVVGAASFPGGRKYTAVLSPAARALGVSLGGHIREAWGRLQVAAGVAPDDEVDPANPLTSPVEGGEKTQHRLCQCCGNAPAWAALGCASCACWR